MPPKKGLSEDEIAATAAVTPKGKEQEKADVGTPKEKTDSKRDRESPENSPFKSPERTTRDLFDERGVPLPSYAKEQLRSNTARRLDFGNVS